MAYKYSPPGDAPATVTRADIRTEFERWNDQAGERIISDYDLPFVKDGTIEATVVWFMRGERREVRVDKWDTFLRNFRCCYLIIRDMRLGEARGLTDAIRAAYGLLPAPKQTRDPFEVLGIRPDADEDVAKAAHRAKAKATHPDTGPAGIASSEAFGEVEDAWNRVREIRGWANGAA